MADQRSERAISGVRMVTDHTASSASGQGGQAQGTQSGSKTGTKSAGAGGPVS
jgi:hypothetical protein